jgi:hypothetical protein
LLPLRLELQPAAAGLWFGRAAAACALIAFVALATPDAPSLAFAHWYGGRIAQAGLPLRLGTETFDAAGAYSGALGWLGALVTYAVSLGGPAATRCATMLAALAAFWLVDLRIARDAGARAGAFAALLAALCALDALRPGGGIETAAFGAALGLVLERPSRSGALVAFAIAVAWCNLAPQGVLAPLIAGAFALGLHLQPADAERRRWSVVAFGGTLLALFATPAWGAYPALAAEALRVDRALGGIVPLHPADLAPLGYRFGFTLAVLTAFAVGTGRRPADALMLVLATLLALANGAYVALFGVLVAPILARAAAELWPRVFAGPSNGSRGLAGRSNGSRGLAVILLAAVVLGAVFGRPLRASESSAGLAGVLAADGRAHRLFCANLDWCDEALGAGHNNVRVLMDGRVAAYPARTLALQQQVVQLKAGWRQALAAAGVDAVLLRRNRAAATILAREPAWRELGAAGSAVLFERREPAQ